MSMNLMGFADVAEDLQIRHKKGGVARLGDVMRPNQRDFIQRVRQYREDRKVIQWVELKPRQFVSMTTITGAVIAGDTLSNEGFDSTVTAQDADSLAEVAQVYRYFFGRTKRAGVEQGKAERLGDHQLVSQTGSRIKLQVADEDLGRSGSKTSLHVSEAGYIKNWTEAWRSVQPALTDAWWRFVIMETTLRRGQAGDFRDFIEEAVDNKYPPWEVHFTSWASNPELSVVVPSRQKIEFQEVCPEYERELVTRHGLTWEQARWYYDTRIGGMLGSYEAMLEAYPTTIAEALRSTKSEGFFRREAMKFYAGNVRPPMQRLVVSRGRLEEIEEGASLLKPHIEFWEPPVYGARYRIGADCADADEREAVEGSENAAVVVNEDSGKVVGVYHGYCNAHEFAEILVLMGQRYNEAEITPEWNNAGRAVIDRMRAALNYTNIYLREKFRYGVAIDRMSGHYGFDTRGNTRSILMDRLQLGVNNRLWDIPSQYLLDCLKAMAKRNGQRVHRRGNKNVQPDDGGIALALTGVGHDKLVERVWQPKQAFEEAPLIEIAKPPRRGYRVMGDDRRKPRWDATWRKWV